MKKLSLMLGFLLVFAGSVMAGDTDRLTPVEETVCNKAGLNGDAFDLCIGYCEAMDCDSGKPKATLEACGKTAQKYAEKTSGGVFPCEMIKELDQDKDGVPDVPDDFSKYFNADQIDLVQK